MSSIVEAGVYLYSYFRERALVERRGMGNKLFFLLAVYAHNNNNCKPIVNGTLKYISTFLSKVGLRIEEECRRRLLIASHLRSRV